MKNWSGKTWFALTVIFAFASVISFFQINSYWADKHHFNGGWVTIGVIAGLVAIFCLIKTAKNSNGTNNND